MSYSLGIKILSVDSTFDLNFYDTYYVISSSYIGTLIVLLVFFSFYLLRSTTQNFKSIPILSLQILSGMGLLILLTKLNGLASFLGSSELKAQPSSTEQRLISEELVTFWESISNTIIGLQLLIGVVLIFFTFKTARESLL